MCNSLQRDSLLKVLQQVFRKLTIGAFILSGFAQFLYIPAVICQLQRIPQLGTRYSFDAFNKFNGPSHFYDAAGMKRAFDVLSNGKTKSSKIDEKLIYYHPNGATVDVNSEQLAPLNRGAGIIVAKPGHIKDISSSVVKHLVNGSQITVPKATEIFEVPDDDKKVIIISEVDGTHAQVIAEEKKLIGQKNTFVDEFKIKKNINSENGPAVFPPLSAWSSSTSLRPNSVDGEITSTTTPGDIPLTLIALQLSNNSASSSSIAPSSQANSTTPKRELVVQLITAANVSGQPARKPNSSFSTTTTASTSANGSSTNAVATSSGSQAVVVEDGQTNLLMGSTNITEAGSNGGSLQVVDGIAGGQSVAQNTGAISSAGRPLVPAAGNSIFGIQPAGSEAAGGFDVAQLFKQLFGVNLLDPRSNRPQGCISRLGGADIVGGIVSSIVDRAVSGALQTCQASASSEQSRTWFDLIPSFLSPGGASNIAGTIVGAVAQTCELETKRSICRMLRDELSNPQCNLCNVIALAFRPAAVNNCACKVVGSLQGDVTRSIQHCIGSGIAGAVVREQFGGLISFPGC